MKRRAEPSTIPRTVTPIRIAQGVGVTLKRGAHTSWRAHLTLVSLPAIRGTGATTAERPWRREVETSGEAWI